jgi:hypothetical protein
MRKKAIQGQTTKFHRSYPYPRQYGCTYQLPQRLEKANNAKDARRVSVVQSLERSRG